MLRTLQPVLQAELRHQRYLIQQGRVGAIWVALAALLLIPGALATLHYTRLAWISVENAASVAQQIILFEGVWVGSLLVAVISLYTVLTLITYGLAANSVHRERRRHTWDSLLLTGVPLWQILLGKWLASLRAVAGDHALLSFLRVGLMSLMALVLPVVITGAAPLSQIGLVIAWGWALAAGVLDAALSAALGVLSALPEGPNAVLVGLLLLALRIGIAAGALAWSAWVVVLPPLSAALAAAVGCTAYAALMTAATFIVGQRW